MIQITPYYMHAKKEEILNLYLSIVADVVPFLPEDVLFDRTDIITIRQTAPRERVKKRKASKDPLSETIEVPTAYAKLLEDFGVPDGKDEKEKRIVDAKLAKEIICTYSKKLHDKLYAGYNDGHVNPTYLRALLTVNMQGGKLDDDFILDDCKDSTSKESLYMLEFVFRYEAFSDHIDVYNLIDMLGVDICPYCNRQFITTYATPKTVSGKKKRRAKTRPQLDHFKVKSKYPYLALSINNLIPSCGVCNHMKGNREEETLYPYSEGMDEKYKFKTTIPDQKIAEVLTGSRIAPELFDIILESTSNEIDESFRGRAEVSKDVFALDGLYQSHKSYVSDMYFQRYIVTEQMIDSIMNQFKGWFRSREEVRQALVLMSTATDALGKRPLAKLTKDIQEEIEAYYAKIRPAK